jgi:hypothetical protein
VTASILQWKKMKAIAFEHNGYFFILRQSWGERFFRKKPTRSSHKTAFADLYADRPFAVHVPLLRQHRDRNAALFHPRPFICQNKHLLNCPENNFGRL